MKLLIIALFTLSSFAGTKVNLKTNKGDIELELFDEKAPISVKNFIEYVNAGFYNGTIFHRVINDFMIQGGGYDSNLGEKKTRAPIKNEATNGLSNDNGTIAMARTQIVDSATAQFFINVKDNAFLNNSGLDDRSYGYAVFGKVTKGMSVVNSIKASQTKSNGPFQNLPVENIVIEKASVIK